MGWGIPACVCVCDGSALTEDVAQLACGCEGAARFALVDLSGLGPGANVRFDWFFSVRCRYQNLTTNPSTQGTYIPNGEWSLIEGGGGGQIGVDGCMSHTGWNGHELQGNTQ